MPKQKEPKSHQLTVTPKYDKGSPPLFTNYTRFSHVGDNVILDIGVLDDELLLQKINADIPSGQGVQVPGYIFQRVGMTLATFLQLRKNVDEIWDKLKASGIPRQLGIEE